MFSSHTATHAATHNATHAATKIQLCLYVYDFTYLLGWSGGVSKSSKHIAVVTEFFFSVCCSVCCSKSSKHMIVVIEIRTETEIERQGQRQR